MRLGTALGMMGFAGAAMLLAGCGQSTSSGSSDPVKRGEYLVSVGACGDCHTPGALLGKPEMDKVFSGGNVGFQIPGLGTFYPPNLTSDKDTGLGNWGAEDVAKAIRTGVRPDGRTLIPVMPYHWYAKLTDDDALAIGAYLKSLAPIANKVPGPFGDGQTPTAPYQIVVVPGATPAQATEQPASTETTPATPQ